MNIIEGIDERALYEKIIQLSQEDYCKAIVSYIRISDDKLCQIPIQYSHETQSLVWKSQDRECYNLYGYKSLPIVSNLWAIVENGNSNYMLPYVNGDDPSAWTKYITDLCSLSIQYNQSTTLPLSLHLAAALKEYLLEI